MKVSIIPRAGLCNRMRAIASGVFIAKHYGAQSTIYWNWEEGLKADFKDLFLPIDSNISSVVENKSWKYNQYNGRKNGWKRTIQSLLFNQFIYAFNSNTDGDIFDKITTNKHLCLCSCHSMSKHYPMNGLFHPQVDIQKRIDEVTSKFTTKTIGVHIRRTDHAKAIAQSPLSKFFDLLDEEIKKDNNVSFYLATDDSEVKAELKQKFGSRILTCDEKVDRNSIEGMKFAVVDLFCLSKTHKIIGSATSSYSEIAAELGNIQLFLAE